MSSGQPSLYSNLQDSLDYIVSLSQTNKYMKTFMFIILEPYIIQCPKSEQHIATLEFTRKEQLRKMKEMNL